MIFSSLHSLVDATLLKEGITSSDLQTLIHEAESYGAAAICIPPSYIRASIEQKQSPALRVATVANFPSGSEPLESVQHCITQALKDGADEIDLVFPYTSYLEGNREHVIHFMQAIRSLIPPNHIFKVILEVCAYTHNAKHLESACTLSLKCGADFLKTSTGMIPYVTTPADVMILLNALKAYKQETSRWAGIKISGGVRTEDQAQTYLKQIQDTMGAEWITPQHVRFGSSTLHTSEKKAAASSY
jgi:deoxyribose-phosphate aldolase